VFSLVLSSFLYFIVHMCECLLTYLPTRRPVKRQEFSCCWVLWCCTTQIKRWGGSAFGENWGKRESAVMNHWRQILDSLGYIFVAHW